MSTICPIIQYLCMMLMIFPNRRLCSAARLFFCCALLLSVHSTVWTQQVSSASKKAVKAYNAGLDKYSRRQYREAINSLGDAMKADNTFVEAQLLIAECYLEMGDRQQAKEAFLRTIVINPGFFPPVYCSVAGIEFDQGEYEKASEHLEKFLTFSKQKPALLTKAEKLLKSSQFAAKAVKNPVPFRSESLNMDFEYDRYWPSLSVDGQTLVFTALIPKDADNAAVTGNRQEDFFVSVLQDGKWTKPRNMGSPPNTPDNEGAQAISADAARMFFTACNRSDGKGGCDIYYSEKRNGLWTRPRNLGAPVNTSAKETQPSVSVDGRTLYFVSSRGGGKGGQDIWTSTLDDEGNWGQPVNLAGINTPDDESSPFIHPDNRTFYFASEGWPGMGQYDLFVTRKDSTGKWSQPENLGYPINSKHNEEGMIVNARGDRAYYSSDRTEKQIRHIFTFDLHPSARPLPASYMKGKIYDAQYYKPIKALFELVDLATAKKVAEAYSDSTNGEFLVCIPSGKDYALNIKCRGYLFYSENFTMSGGTCNEPLLMDIPLKRIQPGEKVVLKNIFFAFDASKLLDESKAELQQLVQFLKDNPEVHVRITGHTDNVGKPAYNMQLSQDRARSVANYILNEGVVMNRVSYKGMGASDPVADNNTEEGRTQNRRTELLIVK